MPTYKNIGKPEKTAVAMDSSAAAVLTYGSIYKGSLRSVDVSTNHCIVSLESPSVTIENCYWAAGSIFCPMFGFKIKTIPAIGTQVAVVYGNPSFVIQMLPSDIGDEQSGGLNTSTGTYTRAESGVYGSGATNGATVDADVLEGEYDISNASGVGLLLLNNLMAMKAGNKAKVEAHLLKDMVRIIADNFEHFSALGVERSFNDGRLNKEESYTSYEHESMNLLDPTIPKASTKGNTVSYDASKDTVEIFRDRYRKYTGWIGDFITQFVKEPAVSASAVLTGKASIRVGSDGSLIQRSVSEIVFERSCRVIVPKRIRRHDDSQGNKMEEFEELPQEPLVSWDYANPHMTAYQLREYARYLSNFYSLARFRQLDKDFSVPLESEVPRPDPFNQETDRRSASSGKKVQQIDTYSTLRLMRDGSVIVMGGDGGTYYSGRGTTQISATSDILLDAGGDLVLIGKNIVAKAYNSIEMTAVTGNFIFKARKSIKQLCEKGAIWLKSDSTPTDGESGIILDSVENRISAVSKKSILLESLEDDVAIKAYTGNVIAEAGENVRISAKKSILIHSVEDVLISCKSMICDVLKLFQVAKWFKVESGKMVARVKAQFSGKLEVAGSIYGPKNTGIALGSKSPPAHTNHIRVFEGSVDGISDASGEVNTLKATKPDLYAKDVVNKLTWKFEKDDQPLSVSSEIEAFHLTHAQDYIETHPEGFTNYIVWNFGEDKLLSAARTDSSSLPWPGSRNNTEKYHPFDAGKKLDTPSDQANWTQTNLASRPMQRKVKK